MILSGLGTMAFTQVRCRTTGQAGSRDRTGTSIGSPAQSPFPNCRSTIYDVTGWPEFAIDVREIWHLTGTESEGGTPGNRARLTFSATSRRPIRRAADLSPASEKGAAPPERGAGALSA